MGKTQNPLECDRFCRPPFFSRVEILSELSRFGGSSTGLPVTDFVLLFRFIAPFVVLRFMSHRIFLDKWFRKSHSVPMIAFRLLCWLFPYFWLSSVNFPFASSTIPLLLGISRQFCFSRQLFGLTAFVIKRSVNLFY